MQEENIPSSIKSSIASEEIVHLSQMPKWIAPIKTMYKEQKTPNGNLLKMCFHSPSMPIKY